MARITSQSLSDNWHWLLVCLPWLPDTIVTSHKPSGDHTGVADNNLFKQTAWESFCIQKQIFQKNITPLHRQENTLLLLHLCWWLNNRIRTMLLLKKANSIKKLQCLDLKLSQLWDNTFQTFITTLILITNRHKQHYKMSINYKALINNFPPRVPGRRGWG